VTGNCSGLARRFHGARQSRILAGDPLAGRKKKRDKLFMLSVRAYPRHNAMQLIYALAQRSLFGSLCCATLCSLWSGASLALALALMLTIALLLPTLLWTNS